METLKQFRIYYALIHSHISYDIIIYGATSDKSLNKFSKTSKRGVKKHYWLQIRGFNKKNIQRKENLFYSLYIYKTAKHCKLLHLPQLSQHPYHTRNRFVVKPHRLENL